MECRRDPDESEIKVVLAAQMHAVGLYSLLRAEAGHLGSGNDGGAGALGNTDGIADMVFMAVGNQNLLAVDLIGFGRGCLVPPRELALVHPDRGTEQCAESCRPC